MVNIFFDLDASFDLIKDSRIEIEQQQTNNVFTKRWTQRLDYSGRLA